MSDLSLKETKRQSAWAQGKRLPDSPDTAHLGVPSESHLPRWALLALRRGEDVPGSAVPMHQRWHDVCPSCGAVRFLIGPVFQPPYLSEIIPDGSPSDLEAYGVHSWEKPQNLIRPHPCVYKFLHLAWEELTVPDVIHRLNNLERFL